MANSSNRDEYLKGLLAEKRKLQDERQFALMFLKKEYPYKMKVLEQKISQAVKVGVGKRVKSIQKVIK